MERLLREAGGEPTGRTRTGEPCHQALGTRVPPDRIRTPWRQALSAPGAHAAEPASRAPACGSKFVTKDRRPTSKQPCSHEHVHGVAPATLSPAEGEAGGGSVPSPHHTHLLPGKHAPQEAALNSAGNTNRSSATARSCPSGIAAGT